MSFEVPPCSKGLCFLVSAVFACPMAAGRREKDFSVVLPCEDEDRWWSQPSPTPRAGLEPQTHNVVSLEATCLPPAQNPAPCPAYLRENRAALSRAAMGSWCYTHSLDFVTVGRAERLSIQRRVQLPSWDRGAGRRCWSNCYGSSLQWLSTGCDRNCNRWRRRRGHQWTGESSLAFCNSSPRLSWVMTLRRVAWKMNSCGEKAWGHLWIAAYSLSETRTEMRAK